MKPVIDNQFGNVESRPERRGQRLPEAYLQRTSTVESAVIELTNAVANSVSKPDEDPSISQNNTLQVAAEQQARADSLPHEAIGRIPAEHVANDVKEAQSMVEKAYLLMETERAQG